MATGRSLSRPLADISSELGPVSRSSRPGSPVPARPRGAGDGRSTCRAPGRASSTPGIPHRAAPRTPFPLRAASARLPQTRGANGPGPPPAGLCVRGGVGVLHGRSGAPSTAQRCAVQQAGPRPHSSPMTPGAAPPPQPHTVSPPPQYLPPVWAAGRGEARGAWPDVSNRSGALRKFPFMATRRRPRPDINRARAAGGSRRELCLPSPRARPAPAAASRPPRLRPRQLPKGESGTATTGDRIVMVLMRIVTRRCYN